MSVSHHSPRGTVALIVEEQRRIDVYVKRQTVDLPPARKVVMVGPHPDDNLFGPGSTAIKYARAGVPVAWLCLTDGRACVADPQERRRMAELRGPEEVECARFLGIPDPELFGLPEDDLTRPEHADRAIERLARAFQREEPDAVFAPYFLENHPLHRFTCHLVAAALRRYPGDCTIYSWAVASFPPPSFVVDTSEVFSKKLEAARCYSTQMAICDYTEQLTALARLHATYAVPAAEFADLFFAQGKAAYIAEMGALGLHLPETLAAGVQPMVPEAESS